MCEDEDAKENGHFIRIDGRMGRIMVHGDDRQTK
jgi:hypothetical protein